MKVVVLGSGGGALAVAADLSRHGRETWLADLPEFRANLEPVAAAGGVRVSSGWHGDVLEQVQVGNDVNAAIEAAELIVVVVPCFGHQPFADLLAPILGDKQALLFMGEGSGAIVARRSLVQAGKGSVVVGETNTLPYLARLLAPGHVSVDRKSGGILMCAVPQSRTSRLLAMVDDVWPFMSAGESIWETTLINFNAIDHVATMLANAGTLESRAGGMLLWGEGATPSVVRLIQAVDDELLELRRTLGLNDGRGYEKFLVAQGFAPDMGADLYSTIRTSKLMQGYVPTGRDALQTRYLAEDVPYALVLASSIANEVGVGTPVIDALIALASAMLEKDFEREGRTLRTLGLSGSGRDGLRRFADEGRWG